MDFFQKIENLPEEVRNYFYLNDVRLEMERACFLYDVGSDDIKKMAESMRNIFFGDLELSLFPSVIEKEFHVKNSIAFGIAYELNKSIFSKFSGYFRDSTSLLEQWKRIKSTPIISEEEARKRVLEIEPWILEKEKEEKKQEEKKRAKYEMLALKKALEKYPHLTEQNVTSNQLKLKYSSEPLRPSIKNWITDYRDNFGAGKHSPIDRGNFLFHSENGKSLSANDRQKLGDILRSLDEETLLTIKPETQTVVFENFISETRAKSVPSTENKMQWNSEVGVELKNEMRTNAKTEISLREKIAALPVVSASINTEQKARAKEIAENNFFQLPQSKPPLGSPTYSPLPERQRENTNVPRGFPAPTVSAAANANDLKHVLGGNAFPANNIKWQEKKVDSKLATFTNQEDLNSLSDEMLFKKLQEKSSKKKVAQNTGNIQVQNSATMNNISFSSTQKFDGEDRKATSFVKSPYHISSSRGTTTKEDFVPKVQGNIVDLKN